MSIFQAILLGLIQGLTEFIPISSTAHLVIAGKLLHIDQQLSPEQITAFNAVIQLGTLVAVLAYFARDIREILAGFITDHLQFINQKPDSKKPGLGKAAQLGYLIIIGTLPIVVIGLAFKKQIEGVFTKNLYVIGGAMIGLAVVLLLAEIVGQRKRAIENLNWVDALVVGCAQCLALIPGSSRSGTTITGCLFMGMTREAAARFSFLLSIPAVGAAGVLEFVKEYKHLDHNAMVAVIIATVVSGISGYASIAFLMHYLKTHSTSIFIAYRLVLGGLIFALLLAKVIAPN